MLGLAPFGLLGLLPWDFLQHMQVLDYHNKDGAQNPVTKERFFAAVKGGDVKEAQIDDLE